MAGFQKLPRSLFVAIKLHKTDHLSLESREAKDGYFCSKFCSKMIRKVQFVLVCQRKVVKLTRKVPWCILPSVQVCQRIRTLVVAGFEPTTIQFPVGSRDRYAIKLVGRPERPTHSTKDLLNRKFLG